MREHSFSMLSSAGCTSAAVKAFGKELYAILDKDWTLRGRCGLSRHKQCQLVVPFFFLSDCGHSASMWLVGAGGEGGDEGGIKAVPGNTMPV